MKISPQQLTAIAPRAAEIAQKLPDHAEGELLVKLKPNVDATSFVDTALLGGADLVERFDIPAQMKQAFGGDLVRIKLPEGVSTAEGIALLENDESLAYVTSNDKRVASAVPNDDQVSEMWGLEQIQAPQAWELTTGSRTGPVIAVLDTGIDADHPDLAPNLWTNSKEIPGNGIDDDGNGVVDDVHGYNATDGSGNPFDDDGHGTHTAGTIGAVGNNEMGVTGINWQAQIMPVKMMVKGEGTVADTVRAVLYATANGAAITSNSYGGPYSQPEYDVFSASPILHICAAGNESNDNDVSRYYPEREVGYPANFELPNIVAVAATSSKDRLAGFSNYGAQTVDLAAPGVKILSTVPGGGYDTKSGTSMATPHVAGVAGLIKTLYPEATADQIKTRLLANVDVLPSLKGKVLTGGRLNALKALENDTVAPATPGVGETSAAWNKATVNWTHSADDGSQGGATTFSELRWKDADGRNCQVCVKGGDSGSAARAEIPLFPSNSARNQQVQVVEIDNVGNASQPAIVNLQVPRAEVAELTWKAEGTWAQIDVPGRTGVWTDSPDGNYANKADFSLSTEPFTLKGKNSELSFETRYRLEAQEDSVDVEVREAGSEDWKALESYTAYREWKRETVDLSAYDGKQIELRFRMKSDSATSDEGIYLDRISVAGAPNS